MLCRKGSVSAGHGRRFCGKADRYGSRMARLTAMALRTMPKCPRNSRDLGLCRQVAGKRRPKSRKPCHNGQPCRRECHQRSALPYAACRMEGIAVSLASPMLSGSQSGRPCRPRPAGRMPGRSTLPSSPCRPDARAVGLAVLTLPAGCQSGRTPLVCPRHPEAWRFRASAFGCARAEGDQAARREGASGTNLCNFIIRLGATRLAGRGIHRACRAGSAAPMALSLMQRDPSRVRGRKRSPVSTPSQTVRSFARAGPEAEGGPSRQPPAGEAPAERIRRNSGDTPGGV